MRAKWVWSRRNLFISLNFSDGVEEIYSQKICYPCDFGSCSHFSKFPLFCKWLLSNKIQSCLEYWGQYVKTHISHDNYFEVGYINIFSSFFSIRCYVYKSVTQTRQNCTHLVQSTSLVGACNSEERSIDRHLFLICGNGTIFELLCCPNIPYPKMYQLSSIILKWHFILLCDFMSYGVC